MSYRDRTRIFDACWTEATCVDPEGISAEALKTCAEYEPDLADVLTWNVLAPLYGAGVEAEGQTDLMAELVEAVEVARHEAEGGGS